MITKLFRRLLGRSTSSATKAGKDLDQKGPTGLLALTVVVLIVGGAWIARVYWGRDLGATPVAKAQGLTVGVSPTFDIAEFLTRSAAATPKVVEVVKVVTATPSPSPVPTSTPFVVRIPYTVTVAVPVPVRQVVTQVVEGAGRPYPVTVVVPATAAAPAPTATQEVPYGRVRLCWAVQGVKAVFLGRGDGSEVGVGGVACEYVDLIGLDSTVRLRVQR